MQTAVARVAVFYLGREKKQKKKKRNSSRAPSFSHSFQARFLYGREGKVLPRRLTQEASVVQSVDSVIHWISCYPLDKIFRKKLDIAI